MQAELDSFMRVPQVRAIRGICNTSLYGEIKAGTFPRPVKIGPRRSAWPASEVDAVQRAHIAGKSREEIRELVKALEAKRLRAADGVMPA